MTVQEVIESLMKCPNKDVIVKVLDEHSQYVPVKTISITGYDVELDG